MFQMWKAWISLGFNTLTGDWLFFTGERPCRTLILPDAYLQDMHFDGIHGHSIGRDRARG
jgi:hypothetical protein